jgi:hypothetical protein
MFIYIKKKIVTYLKFIYCKGKIKRKNVLIQYIFIPNYSAN